MPPKASAIRFSVVPRGVPAAKAARRLGLTETEFGDVCERLFSRGFPRPDPDTERYDIKAIDAWMDQRSNLTSAFDGRHATPAMREQLDAWTPETRSRRKA